MDKYRQKRTEDSKIRKIHFLKQYVSSQKK